MFDAQLALEPHQQCLLHEAAGGGDRQEVRLVGHQQMFVLVEHGRFERNHRLGAQLTVVVDARLRLKRRFGWQWPAVLVEHAALGHALQPLGL